MLLLHVDKRRGGGGPSTLVRVKCNKRFGNMEKKTCTVNFNGNGGSEYAVTSLPNTYGKLTCRRRERWKGAGLVTVGAHGPLAIRLRILRPPLDTTLHFVNAGIPRLRY